MATKSRLRQIQKLYRNIDKLSSGQARISEWDCENLNQFDVEIKPTNGCYEGAKFDFKINLRDDFPSVAPFVQCKTMAYHPNIEPDENPSDDHTNVCFSMFESDNWNSSYGLEGCVLGLLFLIQNPNLEDPLSELVRTDVEMEEFEKCVRMSLAGEEVDGYYFWEFAYKNQDPNESCEDGNEDDTEEAENDEKEQEEVNGENPSQCNETVVENDICDKESGEDIRTLETDQVECMGANENTVLPSSDKGKTVEEGDISLTTGGISSCASHEIVSNCSNSASSENSNSNTDSTFENEQVLERDLSASCARAAVNDSSSVQAISKDDVPSIGNKSIDYKALAECACAMDMEMEVTDDSTKKGVKKRRKEMVVVEDMLVECDELCEDATIVEDMDITEELTLSRNDSVASLILPRLSEDGAVDFETLLYRRIGVLTA